MKLVRQNKPLVHFSGGKWRLLQRDWRYPALYFVVAEADTVRGLAPKVTIWQRIRRALA